MIILCITLLPNDRTLAIPAELGTNIKPTPVTDNVTVVVAPISATVATYSIIEVSVF